MLMGELTDPTVTYKHCSKTDKSDTLDELVENNTAHSSSRPTFSTHNCNGSKAVHQGKSTDILNPASDVSNQNEKSFLERTSITFPIKNKTKAQNSIITNFQFDQSLK